MAQSTVNLQKMKGVSNELDKIYSAITNNKKKLDELMAQLPKMWTGEGAQAFLKSYQQNERNFVMLAEAIRSCSSTLTASATSYGKADMAAAEAIRSKLAKG